MAAQKHGQQAANIIYAFYIDEFEEGRTVIKHSSSKHSAIYYLSCTRSCDLALLLGNMAAQEHGQQAANIIYAFYVDESEEGRMYHVSNLIDEYEVDYHSI